MKNNRRKAVLLMAGKSERFSKTGVKKQFALLLNKESFLYPLESFISSHLFEEIRHFFIVYKQLENKQTSIEEVFGHKEAAEIIAKCIENYNKEFSKQVRE